MRDLKHLLWGYHHIRKLFIPIIHSSLTVCYADADVNGLNQMSLFHLQGSAILITFHHCLSDCITM